MAEETNRIRRGGVSAKILAEHVFFDHTTLDLILGQRDNLRVNLTSTEDKHSLFGGYNGFDSEGENDDSRTVVGILSQYKIIQNLPANTWHKLGSYRESPDVFELLISDSGDGKPM